MVPIKQHKPPYIQFCVTLPELLFRVPVFCGLVHTYNFPLLRCSNISSVYIISGHTACSQRNSTYPEIAYVTGDQILSEEGFDQPLELDIVILLGYFAVTRLVSYILLRRRLATISLNVLNTRPCLRWRCTR